MRERGVEAVKTIIYAFKNFYMFNCARLWTKIMYYVNFQFWKLWNLIVSKPEDHILTRLTAKKIKI